MYVTHSWRSHVSESPGAHSIGPKAQPDVRAERVGLKNLGRVCVLGSA
jgi:hypothetical protein